MNKIRSNIRLFADDTSLYTVVDTPNNSAKTMNTGVHPVHRWSEEWLVDFNASKTFPMTVPRKLNPPLHPHSPRHYFNLQRNVCMTAIKFEEEI